MSRSKRERGEYILNRMQDLILKDLGKGKINAEQAGNIFDLIVEARRNNELPASGITFNMKLAENEYYKKAEKACTKAFEIQRQRFIESRSV